MGEGERSLAFPGYCCSASAVSTLLWLGILQVDPGIPFTATLFLLSSPTPPPKYILGEELPLLWKRLSKGREHHCAYPIYPQPLWPGSGNARLSLLLQRFPGRREGSISFCFPIHTLLLSSTDWYGGALPHPALVLGRGSTELPLLWQRLSERGSQHPLIVSAQAGAFLLLP